MPEFFQQLWKRKVGQFGLLYLGAAWLLLQVAIAVESTMSLPGWLDQSVLVLLVLGFPLALILAWAQDSRADPEQSGKLKKSQSGSTSLSDDPSIVVLPFRHRNDDEIQQLTAEGLTDDITSLLTMVKGLKVAPRQGVARALSDDVDPMEIVRNLGCRYAVTGSVRREGDQLRVSAELVDITDGNQKWSQKFDRRADNVFAIQDEIARGVTVAVGGVISRVEGARALRQTPDSLRAWELTRRAMTVAWDWRPETLAQAVVDLRKAIELDPHYALAHGWLAQLLAWRYTTGWTDNVEAERDEALRLADETFRLGFDDGEALWPALFCYWTAHKPELCVQAFERVIARQPDIFLAFPFAKAGAGVGYARAGDFESGIALIREFEAMYPNDEWGSVWTRVFTGYAELCCGNYELVADVLTNTPSEFDGMCRVVALVNANEMAEAKTEFKRWSHANSEINLGHYIEYFKEYCADEEINRELSAGLVKLKFELTA
ncbi:hypothetical protein [Hyphomonas sp.]|jgi:TolB-like protein|uniref:hypothetical protein n=1 Tax=Hyphomonas sp. TaxID=87 RepID=UPI0039E363E5